MSNFPALRQAQYPPGFMLQGSGFWGDPSRYSQLYVDAGIYHYLAAQQAKKELQAKKAAYAQARRRRRAARRLLEAVTEESEAQDSETVEDIANNSDESSEGSEATVLGPSSLFQTPTSQPAVSLNPTATDFVPKQDNYTSGNHSGMDSITSKSAYKDVATPQRSGSSRQNHTPQSSGSVTYNLSAAFGAASLNEPVQHVSAQVSTDYHDPTETSSQALQLAHAPQPSDHSHGTFPRPSQIWQKSNPQRGPYDQQTARAQSDYHDGTKTSNPIPQLAHAPQHGDQSHGTFPRPSQFRQKLNPERELYELRTPRPRSDYHDRTETRNQAVQLAQAPQRSDQPHGTYPRPSQTRQTSNSLREQHYQPTPHPQSGNQQDNYSQHSGHQNTQLPYDQARYLNPRAATRVSPSVEGTPNHDFHAISNPGPSSHHRRDPQPYTGYHLRQQGMSEELVNAQTNPLIPSRTVLHDPLAHNANSRSTPAVTASKGKNTQYGEDLLAYSESLPPLPAPLQYTNDYRFPSDDHFGGVPVKVGSWFQKPGMELQDEITVIKANGTLGNFIEVFDESPIRAGHERTSSRNSGSSSMAQSNLMRYATPDDAADLMTGTLTNLRDYNNGRAIGGYFANWGPPPEHAIDRSAGGKASIYDGKWGTPPARVGRDLRRQQTMTRDGRHTIFQDPACGR